MKETYEVILLGAGSSLRLGTLENKIMLMLRDRPVYDYALNLFIEDERCEQVIFVVQKEDLENIKNQLLKLYNLVPKKITFVHGGTERQYSVENGLKALNNSEDGYVLVHDAARPFIDKEMINKLFQTMKLEKAVIFAIPAKDTIKVVRNNEVHQTLHRPVIWQVQTPQMFRSKLLLQAHRQAAVDEFVGNEEGELVERMNHPVKVLEGKDKNFKITTATDFMIAEAIVEQTN
ncbi:2-C-methyl-D-erythritol 4-phosphate cytidylyltransferase [Marinilactibacillus psychrotolerans]|uniref:2-C-methyl-D-erythritol 4-phosphate cytidylyltransferase n=1 Tax=Marinilactibacillus psychrotolerans TaxID=191770 RepID=UPI0039AFF95C